MPYSLHPNAQADFDAKADALLTVVVQRFEASEPSDEPMLTVAGLPVPVNVLWQSLQDTNIRTGVMFPLERRAIRIEDDDFLPIIDLAEEIQQRRELSEAVSVQAVLEVLVDWFKKRILAETDAPFINFLLAWLEKNVSEQTIIFPIYRLRFDGRQGIMIGVAGVELRHFEPGEIDRWYEQLPDHAEIRAHYHEQRDHWRPRLNDWAAAFVKVVAEPTHAQEIAYEKVERVLSVLRSFSPAMLIPARRSYCTVYGMEHIPKRTSFIIGPDQLPRVSEPSLEGVTIWSLDERMLRYLAAHGLVPTLALLEIESPTKFQNAVLHAITIYSRASTEPLVEGKLLYIVSAIETLLLADGNEPIINAVARRFAYVVGRDLEERRDVRQRFTVAYNARSGFVHHGRSIDDHKKVSGFMDDAWSFFRSIAFAAANFNTKQEYINALEDEMLAGPARARVTADEPKTHPIPRMTYDVRL